MTDFEYLIRKSIPDESEYSTRHNYFVTTFWPFLLYYSQNILNNSTEEKINLSDNIIDKIQSISNILSKSGGIKTLPLVEKAQEALLKDKKFLKALYDEIISNEQKNPNYMEKIHNHNYTKISFHIHFVAEIICAVRADIDAKVQQLINAKATNKTDIKNYYAAAKENEFALVEARLNMTEKNLIKYQRNILVGILVKLGNFFKEFNLLERYSKNFERELRNHGLRDLAYPLNNEEKEKFQRLTGNKKATITIEELFTEKYLETLSIPKLTALTAFWANRAAKDIESLNELLFIIYELNLWKNLENNIKLLELDPKILQQLFTKTNFLISIETSIFDKIELLRAENPHLETEEINEKFNKIFDEEISKYKNEYKIFFSKVFPNSENDFCDDLSSLHNLENTKYLLYSLKNNCLINLAMGSIDCHYSKNWGIVPDGKDKSEFINIYFDIEGLNMPLRLHMPKSLLTTFILEYTGKPFIPLYNGAKDLTIHSQNISTSILAPLCQKQSEVIRKKLAEQGKYSPDVIRFLKHILFLRNNDKSPWETKLQGQSNVPNYYNLLKHEKIFIKPDKKQKNKSH